jgi:uncharacterized membrane protein YciS (DUF1049 family)
MIGYIITAIVFSIPTVYYRIKLKQAERKIKRHIETRWMWENWGE